MDTIQRSRLAIAGCSGALLLSLQVAPAVANEQAVDDSFGDEWKPVDPARLDAMRGGFELPSGMVLSFGIERAVYVNGDLVASTSLQVPDIARITPQQAQEVAEFNKGLLVQLGEGNTVVPGQMGGGIVIQNSLDNQQIVTLTQVDVSTNMLGTFQAMNLGNLIGDAISSGLTGL